MARSNYHFYNREGAKSYTQDKNADMRLPITSTVLYKIVSALKHTVSTRYEQILLRAMLTLDYHALLRVGEMIVSERAVALKA